VFVLGNSGKMHHIVKNNFLMPALKLDDQKFEFIFLLDNSGSMSGSPMELAKKALIVCTKLLYLE